MTSLMVIFSAGKSTGAILAPYLLGQSCHFRPAQRYCFGINRSVGEPETKYHVDNARSLLTRTAKDEASCFPAVA